MSDSKFSPTASQELAILTELARLGGAMLTDDGIVHEGTRLVVPENMSMKDAVKALMRKIESEDEEVSFSVTIDCRPWDGAAAFERVVKKHFGFLTQVSTQGMFGKQLPEMRTIKTGVHDEIQVPWGRVQLPLFPGANIDLYGTNDREKGVVFMLLFTGPRRWRGAVAGLFKLVEKEVRENSIYRGKAFNGAEMPDFLDLSGVDPRHVVYSDDVMAQLEANVWSLLRYSEEHRSQGLPLKRAVLLEGPYGTGKTLGAYLTAKEAVERGWTFIYCRPGKDDIYNTLKTAKLYQPAVVFFEDMDEISDGDSADKVSTLLDAFDGMTSKGTELMVILTTNHADRIHKGMIRPGRLDAVIHIGALDANGVHRMILANVPSDLVGTIDVTEVWAHMQGFMPAFVKEAIDRAKRYSLVRNGGRIGKLNTEDFVLAADGLRPQLELMEGNMEHQKKDRLSGLIQNLVAQTIVPDFVREEVLESAGLL